MAPVPEGQRTQTSTQMFIVWLMASASATTPLIGALLFHFGLTDMIIAIVVSWLIGFIRSWPPSRTRRCISGTWSSAASTAGWPAPVPVAAQRQPDPAFPTLPYPNPEEPGVLDLARETAEQAGADLVLANDPDADRLAVMVPGPDGWQTLTGDELGALLGDAVLTRLSRGELAADPAGRPLVVATTVVSGSLLRRLAEAAGIRCVTTLTGFKWITRAGGDDGALAYGYEQALGYAVRPDLVADKDGISAALLVLQLATEEAQRGRTLLDRLDDLALTHGLHVTRLRTLRADGAAGLARLTAAVERVRKEPPQLLAGQPVTVTDLREGASGAVAGRARGRTGKRRRASRRDAGGCRRRTGAKYQGIPVMTENTTITRAELARTIDHTLLAPEATGDDVTRLAKEADQLGAGAICISPSRLPLAPEVLAPGIAVAAVIGFPSGAHPVAAVRAAIGPSVVLKVIIETAVIGPDRIAPASHATEAGGAEFVKTSIGFHPAGGATVQAVTAIAAAVGGRLGIKASGGIRTTGDALAMIAAGATRIGASHTAAILDGLPDE